MLQIIGDNKKISAYWPEYNRSAVRVTIVVKERLDETLVEWREKRVVFVIREADLLAGLTFNFRQIFPAFLGNLSNLWSILRVFSGHRGTIWGGRWGEEVSWEARSCYVFLRQRCHSFFDCFPLTYCSDAEKEEVFWIIWEEIFGS